MAGSSHVLSDANADASFAGHAHGGQIRIFDKGIYSPDQGWFPKLTSGMHKLGSNTLMISRGLGDHTMMPRINNAPELVVCHIKGEKS